MVLISYHMVHPTQPFVFISRQITFLALSLCFTNSNLKQQQNSLGRVQTNFMKWGCGLILIIHERCVIISIFSACFNCNISAARYPPQAQNDKTVSLTSMPGKIMDQILLETIVKHMESKDVMGDSKHGFSKDKLCLKNLVAFYDGYRGSGRGKSD